MIRSSLLARWPACPSRCPFLSHLAVCRDLAHLLHALMSLSDQKDRVDAVTLHCPLYPPFSPFTPPPDHFWSQTTLSFDCSPSVPILAHYHCAPLCDLLLGVIGAHNVHLTASCSRRWQSSTALGYHLSAIHTLLQTWSHRRLSAAAYCPSISLSQLSQPARLLTNSILWPLHDSPTLCTPIEEPFGQNTKEQHLPGKAGHSYTKSRPDCCTCSLQLVYSLWQLLLHPSYRGTPFVAFMVLRRALVVTLTVVNCWWWPWLLSTADGLIRISSLCSCLLTIHNFYFSVHFIRFIRFVERVKLFNSNCWIDFFTEVCVSLYSLIRMNLIQ